MATTFRLPARIFGEPRLSHPKAAAFVQHSKNCALMSQMGHSRHSAIPGVSGSPQERTFGQGRVYEYAH
jgi:hypothetical protein